MGRLVTKNGMGKRKRACYKHNLSPVTLNRTFLHIRISWWGLIDNVHKRRLLLIDPLLSLLVSLFYSLYPYFHACCFVWFNNTAYILVNFTVPLDQKHYRKFWQHPSIRRSILKPYFDPNAFDTRSMTFKLQSIATNL